MGVTEFWLLSNEIDRIFERVSQKIPLTRRSLIALVIMASERNKIYTNQLLQQIFLQFKMSSENSAQKDVSIVKSELLHHQYIRTVLKVSEFALTDSGIKTVANINDEIMSAINESSESAQMHHLLYDGLRLNLPIAEIVEKLRTPRKDVQSDSTQTSLKLAFN